MYNENQANNKKIVDTTTKDLVMYFLVNSEIEMSKGKVSGQIAHAMMRFMYVYAPCIDIEPLVDEYMRFTNEKKVVLTCTEKELIKYHDETVGSILVEDMGLTELEPNTITCVCLGILDRNDKENKTLKSIKRKRLYK